LLIEVLHVHLDVLAGTPIPIWLGVRRYELQAPKARSDSPVVLSGLPHPAARQKMHALGELTQAT
jgi:hypothetical protein